jgi:Nickel responsive protein SCO4226-like
VVPRTRARGAGLNVALVKPTTPEQGSLYLVERYLAVAAADGLPDAVARVAGACAASGDQVRYLHSTYLPSEDTCFCLFEAVSTEAVQAVNAVAGFAIDRITGARVMFDASPRSVSPSSGQLHRRDSS